MAVSLQKRFDKWLRSPILWFLFFAALNLAYSLILAVGNHGRAFAFYTFEEGTDRFMDFFNHIAYSEHPSQVYFANISATFPPLIYLFYGFLYRILPIGTVAMFTTHVGSYGLLIYVIYNGILFAGLYECIRCALCMDDRSEWLARFLFLAMVFAYPFFCTVERGNSCLIVLVLLLTAVQWRNDSSALKRELAMIFIAIACGCKVYAVFFGLLYLRERRFKECLRLVIYGIIFFFGPFIFCGGLAGFKQFIDNQLRVMSLTGGAGGSIGLLAQRMLAQPLSATGVDVGQMATFIYSLIALLVFFRTREKWIEYLMLIGLMTLVPSWSGEYTRIFYLIPLIAFLERYEGMRGKDCIAAAFLPMWLMVFSTLYILRNAMWGFNISIFGSYLLSAAGLLYGIWTALPRPSHK